MYNKIELSRLTDFLIISAPSSPRGLTVVGKTSTSMNISWQLPADNRECVHHYRICYKPLDLYYGVEKVAEKCIETFDTSITITDLEPCAKFRIRVSAVTALGSYSIESIKEDTTEFESKCLNFPNVDHNVFNYINY